MEKRDKELDDLYWSGLDDPTQMQPADMLDLFEKIIAHDGRFVYDPVTEHYRIEYGRAE